jgi:hypothetical protein
MYTLHSHQQEYQLLYQGYKNNLTKESIAAIALNQHEFKGIPISTLCKKYAELHKQNGGITVELTNKFNEILPTHELNKEKKHYAVFDDCMNVKNQFIMESYFSDGRQSNCNSIYLTQDYFKLNKTIRKMQTG